MRFLATTSGGNYARVQRSVILTLFEVSYPLIYVECRRSSNMNVGTFKIAKINLCSSCTIAYSLPGSVEFEPCVSCVQFMKMQYFWKNASQIFKGFNPDFIIMNMYRCTDAPDDRRRNRTTMVLNKKRRIRV